MDLNKLIAGIAQSGVASSLAGGVAGGALTSALLSKKGRRYARTALAAGGIAAVGGLAWKAYQSYRVSQGLAENADGGTARKGALSRAQRVPAAVPRDWQGIDAQAFEIPEDAGPGSRGLLLVRAMIAAAGSDGHIDPEEKLRIFARVDELNLSSEEKGLLFDELARPARLYEIAEQVHDPETAAEVYAASLLAIDTSRAQGRVYLQNLAEILVLPAPLVRHIHAEAGRSAGVRREEPAEPLWPNRAA